MIYSPLINGASWGTRCSSNSISKGRPAGAARCAALTATRGLPRRNATAATACVDWTTSMPAQSGRSFSIRLLGNKDSLASPRFRNINFQRMLPTRTRTMTLIRIGCHGMGLVMDWIGLEWDGWEEGMVVLGLLVGWSNCYGMGHSVKFCHVVRY